MHETLIIKYIQQLKKNKIFSMKTSQLVHIKLYYKIGKFNILSIDIFNLFNPLKTHDFYFISLT